MTTAAQMMQSSALTTHTQSSVTTAPVREHACLFTHDVRRKQKRWQDGRLKYHTFNRRVMVHDERGNFVGDTYWREDYELADGDDLELERGGIIIQVGECVGSRDQDLSDLIDKRAEERAQRQAAAAARRPPVAPITTLHGVKPQPLPQKHLHDVIGTPSGHHGRAVLPKESPYEERRQRQPQPQSDDTRPAKRQRREITPPSKSGYAQNLFGATLTLSGRPSSQASSHSRSSRQIPLQANGAQLSTNTFARLHNSIRPESPSCINPTILDDPGKSSAQKQRRSIMVDQENERIAACSVPDSKSTNHYSRKCREVGGSLGQQALRTGQPRESPAFGGSKKISDRKRPGAGNECIQGNKHQDLNIINLTEDSAENPKPFFHGEPRTELRIKPRKKRGLLVISERDTISDSSSKPKLANTGPNGHECPSSPEVHPIGISSDQEGDKPKSMDTQHNWADFPQEDREIGPRGNKMNAEKNDQEGTSGHLSSCLANTRRLEDVGFDEMQSSDPFYPESWKGTKLTTAIEQDDTYTTKTYDIESRSLRSVKRPPNEGTIFTPGIDKDHGYLRSTKKEDSLTIDKMPVPRLAKLGRKSIKSKEVIGIIFEDESDPIVSLKQKEHGQEPSLEFQPDRDIGEHQHQPNSKVCDGFATTEGRPDTEPPSSGKRLLAIQGQKSWNPKLSNHEASRTIHTEDASSTVTTTITKQPSPSIVNPATRGKKAAKPSDAAGQMPICPLPAESVESSSFHQNPRKINMQKSLGKGSATPLPGFYRANGGPWSREAHDLFDFKRP